MSLLHDADDVLPFTAQQLSSPVLPVPLVFGPVYLPSTCLQISSWVAERGTCDWFVDYRQFETKTGVIPSSTARYAARTEKHAPPLAVHAPDVLHAG